MTRRIDVLNQVLDEEWPRLEAGELTPTELVALVARRANYSERQVWRHHNKRRDEERIDRPRKELDEAERAAMILYDGKPSTAYRVLQRTGEVDCSESTFLRAARREFTTRDRAQLSQEGVMARRRMNVVMPVEATSVNEIWEMDDTQLPFKVVDDDGVLCEEVWVTAALDHDSRAVVSYTVVVGRPTGEDVRDVLLQGMVGARVEGGVRLGGVPGAVRFDQGANYGAEVVQDLCDATQTMILSLPAYSPHLKGRVERLFKTVKHEYLAELPGRTNNPKGRNDRPRPASEAISLALLCEKVEEAIAHYNAGRLHSALETTPTAWWQQQAHNITYPEWFTLLPWMETFTSKPKSYHEGLSIDGDLYVHDDTSDWSAHRLTVKWIPGHHRVHVFRDADFLCEAVRKDMVTNHDRNEMTAGRTRAGDRARKVTAEQQDLKTRLHASEPLPDENTTHNEEDAMEWLLDADAAMAAVTGAPVDQPDPKIGEDGDGQITWEMS